MYSYGGPCIAVEGPIGIFITMYWCVWLCILFLLASLYLGYFKPLYDKYTKYLPGQVQHRKSAIHGLPVTLRMFRVKFDKSDWFWSQSLVFTKPFKNGMPLD